MRLSRSTVGRSVAGGGSLYPEHGLAATLQPHRAWGKAFRTGCASPPQRKRCFVGVAEVEIETIMLRVGSRPAFCPAGRPEERPEGKRSPGYSTRASPTVRAGRPAALDRCPPVA